MNIRTLSPFPSVKPGRSPQTLSNTPPDKPPFTAFQGQADSLVRFGALSPKAREALKGFRETASRIHSLKAATAVTTWEQWTEGNMPEKSDPIHSQISGDLSAMTHELSTNPQMRAWVKTLTAPDTLKQLKSRDRHEVLSYQRYLETDGNIPANLVKALTSAGSKGYVLWSKAKNGDGNFSEYEAQLGKIIGLIRQKQAFQPRRAHPLDGLLENYDKGMTVKEIDRVFGALKPDLVALVKAIKASPVSPPDDTFRFQTYDLARQDELMTDALKDMGYDFTAGKTGKTTHPFQSTISAPHDVRVALRSQPNDLFYGLYTAIHEGGHGLYEQGVSPKLAGSSVASVRSYSLHESQSRIWEVNVGHSRAFAQYIFPKLQAKFPEQLTGDNAPDQEGFYRALNKVQAGPVRLAADEVTYNLHIMLRYEIERDLFAGKLKVKDIDQRWREKTKEYLGVEAKGPHEGPHQDSHWSDGGFGYFFSYGMGNLAAAQFFATAKRQLDKQHGEGYLEKQIAQGNLKVLRDWLKTNIHRHGGTKTMPEIMKLVTGEPLNPKYFMDYLWQKYSPLYQLDEATMRPHTSG